MGAQFLIIPHDDSLSLRMVSVKKDSSGMYLLSAFQQIVGGKLEVITLKDNVYAYVHHNLRLHQDYEKYANHRVTDFFSTKNAILGNAILFSLSDNGDETTIDREIIYELRERYGLQ